MTHAWHDVTPGEQLPSEFTSVIEIPRGSSVKYELDKSTGMLRLDRMLHSAVYYPANYGFIPQTLAEDGDALDILVMVNEPTFSGCLIQARVVGLFRMKDRGQNDFKVLAVPNTDPLFGEYKDLNDVANHFLREVEHFFATYKQLEGIHIETQGWDTAANATAEVHRAVDRYLQALTKEMLGMRL